MGERLWVMIWYKTENSRRSWVGWMWDVGIWAEAGTGRL